MGFIPSAADPGEFSVDDGNVISGGVFGVAGGLQHDGDPKSSVHSILNFDPHGGQIGKFDAGQSVRWKVEFVFTDLQRGFRDVFEVGR